MDSINRAVEQSGNTVVAPILIALGCIIFVALLIFFLVRGNCRIGRRKTAFEHTGTV